MTILNNDYTDFIKYCNNEIVSYESQNITNIRYSAFKGNNYIKSLSFPKVTTLDNYCFSHMNNLEQLNLPNVTRLGQGFLTGSYKISSLSFPKVLSMQWGYVFEGVTGLVSLSMPNCTSIPECCFRGCESLTTLDFITNVTYIGTEAFGMCYSLTDMSLDSLVTLDSKAFSNCNNLIKIWIPSSCSTINAKNWDNQESVEWSPFYGCNSNCVIYTDAESPKNTWSKYWNYYDDTHKLEVCWGASYQDYINDTYKTKSTLENFVDGSIREFIYPDNITLVDHQFYGCSYLFNIQLPTVTTLPSGALWYCTGLKGEIPQMFPNVTTIEDVCFTNCTSLTSADLSNVVSVADSTFQSCANIRKVWLPSTCTTVGSPLFPNCYNVTFYTDASEDLPGWEENWNSLDWDNTKFGTVVYNATYEQYLQA